MNGSLKSSSLVFFFLFFGLFVLGFLGFFFSSVLDSRQWTKTQSYCYIYESIFNESTFRNFFCVFLFPFSFTLCVFLFLFCYLYFQFTNLVKNSNNFLCLATTTTQGKLSHESKRKTPNSELRRKFENWLQLNENCINHGLDS